MKKHKPIKSQPLFRKEKEYLKVINNPKKMEQLKAVIDSALKTQQNIVHPETLDSWLVYVLSILPKFEKDVEFTAKLGELVNEYSNERKGSDTVESC